MRFKDKVALITAAANGLSSAYTKAAKTLGGLQVSPADKLANAQLVTGLKATSKAYAGAAKAANKHNKRAYAKAGKAVVAGQQTVSKALAGLKSAGYHLRS